MIFEISTLMYQYRFPGSGKDINSCQPANTLQLQPHAEIKKTNARPEI